MTPTSIMRPYKVEWRGPDAAVWVKLRELDEHPGDLKKFVAAQDRWPEYGGTFRLVSQHVIEEVFG